MESNKTFEERYQNFIEHGGNRNLFKTLFTDNEGTEDEFWYLYQHANDGLLSVYYDDYESGRTFKERYQNFINHGGTIGGFMNYFIPFEGTEDEFWTLYKGIESELSNQGILGNIWSFLRSLGDGFNFLFNFLFNPTSDQFFVNLFIDALRDLTEALFVPSEERLTAIQNTISSRFAFIDSIKYAIESIQNVMNNLGNAPRLEITLPSTKYSQEMQIYAIDLNWYAPYKSYGDLILTGFIYFAFVWRIFIRLSSIINGGTGTILGEIDPNNYTGGLKD